MTTLRKAGTRGHALHGWLESRHSFSPTTTTPRMCASAHCTSSMKTSCSPVMVSTRTARDSVSNGEDIHIGEIQLMRTGSGVQYSEFNPSDGKAVHLLQVWIMPDEQGLAPGYWQKTFPDKAKRWRRCLRIHQDARLPAALLDYPIAAGRKTYMHVTR